MALGRLAVALGVLSVSSAAAIAADLSLPPRPYAPYAPAYYHPAVVYEWTGFYIGGSAGGGFGLGGIDTTAVPITFDIHPDGFIGGGQIGYNYQMGGVVWGVEADFSGADIRGSDSKTATALIGANAVSIAATGNQKLDDFGTLRGRVGVVPFTPLLIYATGGLAYGHASADVTFSETCSCGTNSTATVSASSNRWGWTVGGGIEWLFTPHWSLKGEFLYYNLGQISADLGTIIGTTSTVHVKGDIARAGINYKF
jgi:outer membrane immunogenic protein